MRKAKLPPIGSKFGRLTVVDNNQTKGANKARASLCKCDCGRTTIVVNIALYSKNTRSCGCLLKETTHNRFYKNGRQPKDVYYAWVNMKQRCYNKNNCDFNHYGGRGIKVCDRWLESFKQFYQDMGDKEKGMTLDRIDVNKNYEPDNCRWASRKQQSRNRRDTIKVKYKGKITPLAEVCEEINKPVGTIYDRLFIQHIPFNDAIKY